jgi:3-oxoacyl-[acyl-carrier protein] reductase
MADAPVALITGSRSGIGRSLAEHLLAAGYRVVGCSRSRSDLDHEYYRHVLADVTVESDVKRLVKSVRREEGRLDALVANAGVASMNHALLTPNATVEHVTATNFVGTYGVARESAKVMMKRRGGRIVTLSTVAVPLRLEGEAAYAASKAAVEVFTRVFAREVGAYGITVNAVGPTPIETDLIRGVPADKIQEIVDRLAVKRLGTFDDVANVVDFLLSARSSAVTGQVIYLGGP